MFSFNNKKKILFCSLQIQHFRMPTIIAFHTLHDANVCVSKDGKLLAILELESKIISFSSFSHSLFSQSLVDNLKIDWYLFLFFFLYFCFVFGGGGWHYHIVNWLTRSNNCANAHNFNLNFIYSFIIGGRGGGGGRLFYYRNLGTKSRFWVHYKSLN